MILEGTTIDIDKGNPSQMIVVLAMNYPNFANWCRRHDINPRSRNVKFVRDVFDFRHLVNCWYKDLGVPYVKAHEVYNMLEHYKATRGFKEIPS